MFNNARNFSTELSDGGSFNGGRISRSLNADSQDSREALSDSRRQTVNDVDGAVADVTSGHNRWLANGVSIGPSRLAVNGVVSGLGITRRE